MTKLISLALMLLELCFPLSHTLSSPFVSVSVGVFGERNLTNVNNDTANNNNNNNNNDASSALLSSFHRMGESVEISCDFEVDSAALSEAADGLPLEDIVQDKIVEWDFSPVQTPDDDEDEEEGRTSGRGERRKLSQHMIGIRDWSLWDKDKGRWVPQR